MNPYVLLLDSVSGETVLETSACTVIVALVVGAENVMEHDLIPERSSRYSTTAAIVTSLSDASTDGVDKTHERILGGPLSDKVPV